MMVIMQAFATNNNIPRHNVSAVIFSFAISISPPMSDAVDNSGCPKRYPDHLDAPN
jgi:hypothetical protein